MCQPLLGVQGWEGSYNFLSWIPTGNPKGKPKTWTPGSSATWPHPPWTWLPPSWTQPKRRKSPSQWKRDQKRRDEFIAKKVKNEKDENCDKVVKATLEEPIDENE